MPDIAVDTVGDSSDFHLTLENFEGPFDLLLNLISKHELDISEISLSIVTNEFLSYLKNIETTHELEKASEFIVVAATLLDMKLVSLLPGGELVDPEEAAVLEARDLLFAKLLQYRAFKLTSAWFDERIAKEALRHPRQVRLDKKFVDQAPELIWQHSVEDFAAIALLALTPQEIPMIGLSHLHAPLVSIREQAGEVINILRQKRKLTFRELIVNNREPGVVIARFLAVLELFRNNALTFQQDEPLGELILYWQDDTFNDEKLAHLGAEFDG